MSFFFTGDFTDYQTPFVSIIAALSYADYYYQNY